MNNLQTILALLLVQRNDRLRLLALQALVHLDDSHALSYLLICLGDPASSIREEAVRLLGMLGDVRAIDPLIATMADAERNVRCEATRALSRLAIP